MADVANVSTSAATLSAPNARSVAATEHRGHAGGGVEAGTGGTARAGAPTSATKPELFRRPSGGPDVERSLLLGIYLPALEGAASVVCKGRRIPGAPVQGAGQKRHGRAPTMFRADAALPFTL